MLIFVEITVESDAKLVTLVGEVLRRVVETGGVVVDAVVALVIEVVSVA